MFVGISNNVSKVGTTDIANEEFHVHARKRPWDDWQFMLDRSPVYHAAKSKTPTLILHGTLDEVVPIGQSDLLAARLKELGVPAEYERIDGWPHVMDASLPVNEYFKARIARFLEDRLRR